MAYRHVRAQPLTESSASRRRPPVSRPRTDPLALQRAAEARVAEALTERFAWFLAPVRINAIAEDLRAMERVRQFDLGVVVLSVILSALSRSSDTEGRVRDAFALYRQIHTTVNATDEGFRKAMGRSATVLLHLLQQWMREASSVMAPLRGRLSFFKDLLLTDSTCFKLARALAGALPGSGTTAALKLHAIYSVRAQTALSVEATEGRAHDAPHFRPVWQPGALYLWDLGYNDYDRAVDAHVAAAFFAQRLKDKANPRVLAWYDPEGRRHEVARGPRGALARLDEVLAQTPVLQHGGALDLDVVLEGKGVSAVLRVVCVPSDGQDRYYLTNLPREHFSPHDVAEIYAARWEVELLFKDWQGGCRLDEVARLSNLDTLRAAIYGGLLAHLLSRELARAARPVERVAPDEIDEDDGDVTESAPEPQTTPTPVDVGISP